MRDLIEAGLSAPAETLAIYGISAETLVRDGRAWVVRLMKAFAYLED